MSADRKTEHAVISDISWEHKLAITGASHHRTELPCQDYAEVKRDTASGHLYRILAVADGHGDPKHDLSQIGSRLAVTAALEELRLLFENEARNGPPNRKSIADAFKSRLPRAVTNRWRRLVQDDANSTDEAANYTRYGTTLLIALITTSEVYLGQIGDGDILAVNPEDNNVEQVFSPRSVRIGTATDSLCMPNASRLWQTGVISLDRVALLLLATDGLGDSFEDQAGLQKFAADVHDQLSRPGGRELVETRLTRWLQELTEKGSGDDIAVAMFAAHAPNRGLYEGSPGDGATSP